MVYESLNNLKQAVFIMEQENLIYDWVFLSCGDGGIRMD